MLFFAEETSRLVNLKALDILLLFKPLKFARKRRYYSAFTESGATQTMKTNQMAELKQ
jgi:hypothetical protein